MSLNKQEEDELLSLVKAEEEYTRYNKINIYFSDNGYQVLGGEYIHPRSSYPKHLTFFKAGSKYKQRCFMAGNRTGKSLAGAYETACHLTGIYPKWWNGLRYSRPITAYGVCPIHDKTRDVIQKYLLGEFSEPGTGMIAKHLIDLESIKSKPNVPNAVSYFRIKHIMGGYSEIYLMAYQQGVDAFTGTAVDWVWEDEEPPPDINSEILVRTMTTKGNIILTFTPIKSMSDVVMSYLPNGEFPQYDEDLNYIPKNDIVHFSKFTISVTWDDVPHLTEQEKKEQWDNCPAYLRVARSKGIPAMGQGRVYPIEEDEFIIKPIEIPFDWPRVIGLDVGWNRTAAVWGAIDPNTKTTYIYDEYYKGQAEPGVHATNLILKSLSHFKLSGYSKHLVSWIPVVIDPAARGRSQTDGKALFDLYSDLGLELYKADNAVDAGIYTCLQRISSGKTKVFNTLHNFLQEYRLYQYDDKGHVKKKNDHLMDAWRYLEMSGIDKAISFNLHDYNNSNQTVYTDSITGY